jgi:SAM-dependent methyltransferase
MIKIPSSKEAHPARDPSTISFYSEEAPIYTASGRGSVNRGLYDFLKLLPPRARILELGCGGGRDAEAMIAAGFDVDPTDGIPEIARKAEERLGRNVRVLRFDELDTLEAYDAIWASASLLHVPRISLPHVLELVFNALKPGGLHFASYKGGGTEGRDRYGRYFNYLSRQDVTEIYDRSAPWEAVSMTEYFGGGYDGQQGPWVAITVRKPK